MILRRSMLVIGLMQAMLLQGVTFCPEDRAEITTCWRDRVWRAELASPVARSSNWQCYVNQLLDFQDEDLVMAGQMISSLCKGELWNDFLEHKDEPTTMKFIEFMTLVLQRVVADECQLTFPPKLQDIEAEITRSGLSEDEFCTKLRQAFLAFTIVVSNMEHLIRQQASK